MASDERRNAFGFLRLAAAIAVIVSHSWPLGGYGPEPLARAVGQLAIGDVAVFVFFVVSGYLITQSRLRSGGWRFAWNRVIRILPAHTVAVLVVAAIGAPLIYLFRMGTLIGFDLDSAIRFAWVNLGLDVHQWTVDGVLSGHPHPDGIAGSWWTLIYEARCYLLVALLATVGVLRSRPAMVAVAAFFWLVAVFGWSGPSHYWLPLHDPHFASLATYFLAGSMLFLYRDRTPRSARCAWLAAIAVVVTIAAGLWHEIGFAFGAYLVIHAARTLPWRRVGNDVDLSYGVYLYGFTVQQALWAAGLGSTPIVVFATVAVLLSCGLAWISWVCVERPAFALRRVRTKATPPTVMRDERSVVRLGQ